MIPSRYVYCILLSLSWYLLHMYMLTQSVVAADSSILKVRPDLPALDDLMTCDTGMCMTYLPYRMCNH